LVAVVVDPIPNLLLFAALAAAIALILWNAGGGRRRSSGGAPAPAAEKVCPSCGAAHPTFAAFCRRCGKTL
jgi:hypothetical protein